MSRRRSFHSGARDGPKPSRPAVEPRKLSPRRNNKWLQSQKTNNPELAALLLADKFVNTSSDGKVTGKTETLATAKAAKYIGAEYESVQVTVFGNTAIATGVFSAKGTDASGKPMDIS